MKRIKAVLVIWQIKEMKLVGEYIGIDGASLVRFLDFLPYPFLTSEYRNGDQYNTFVNKKFTDEIGYTCEAIPTINSWFKMAYPDPVYREEVIRDWQMLLVNAKSLGEDSVVKKAKIQTRCFGAKWYEVKASVFGPLHLVAFVNIDDEINKELKLAALNENKDRTLSILSHDLRSPLNNFLSVLELAAGNNLTENERTEMLKKIAIQVHQMTDFLDTTLHWSNVNFSETRVVNERVSVKPIVEKLIHLYRAVIDDKKITTIVGISNEVSPWADKEIVSILVRNVLSNAIKYTPVSGWIKIYSQVIGDKYVLTVENSGKGISAEKMLMIKSNNANSERGTQGEKGLGLGLRLCQQLLNTIGGTLEIEDRQSEVAVFRIIL